MKTDPERSHREDDQVFAVRVTLIVIVVLAVLIGVIL